MTLYALEHPDGRLGGLRESKTSAANSLRTVHPRPRWIDKMIPVLARGGSVAGYRVVEVEVIAADRKSEIARLAQRADRLKNSARFLLDMLQRSNEEVEAMYGRADTLEQAAIELRRLIEEDEA